MHWDFLGSCRPASLLAQANEVIEGLSSPTSAIGHFSEDVCGSARGPPADRRADSVRTSRQKLLVTLIGRPSHRRSPSTFACNVLQSASWPHEWTSTVAPKKSHTGPRLKPGQMQICNRDGADRASQPLLCSNPGRAISGAAGRYCPGANGICAPVATASVVTPRYLKGRRIRSRALIFGVGSFKTETRAKGKVATASQPI